MYCKNGCCSRLNLIVIDLERRGTRAVDISKNLREKQKPEIEFKAHSHSIYFIYRTHLKEDFIEKILSNL